MSNLEEVFLANVILFVESLETILKFIQVSRKCFDTCLMIKLIPIRSRLQLKKSSEDTVDGMKEHGNWNLSRTTFKLFPKAETIDVDSSFFEEFKEELLQIPNIIIKYPMYENTIPTILFNNIIEINIMFCGVSFSLNGLNHLKRCRISIASPDFTIFDYLDDVDIYLDLLEIRINYDCENLNDIRQFKHIKKILFVFQTLYPPKEDYTDFATVCYDGISFENTQYISLQPHGTVLYPGIINKPEEQLQQLKKINQLYFPMKIHLISFYQQSNPFDFTEFTQLVVLLTSKSVSSIKYPLQDNSPFCLNHLRTQSSEYNLTLPTSLTSFKIEHKGFGFINIPTHTLLKQLELQECVVNQFKFPQLTKLIIQYNLKKEGNDIIDLTPLDCLIDLTFKNISLDINSKYFPTVLQKLSITSSDSILPTTLQVYTSLTYLSFNYVAVCPVKSLEEVNTTNVLNDNSNTHQNEVVLHTPYLKCLQLNNCIPTKFPIHLTQLVIKQIQPTQIDLRICSVLSVIGISCEKLIEVILPRSIKEVYLQDEPAKILNIKELTIKELTLDSTNEERIEEYFMTSVTTLLIFPFPHNKKQIRQGFPNVK